MPPKHRRSLLGLRPKKHLPQAAEHQQLLRIDGQANHPVRIQIKKRLRYGNLRHEGNIGNFPTQDGQIDAQRRFARTGYTYQDNLCLGPTFLVLAIIVRQSKFNG